MPKLKAERVERPAKTLSECAYEWGYQNGLEAAAPKWISVEERLPEELEDVLVLSRNGSCTWAEVAHLMRNQWWRVGIPMINVTHWMPLPEAPKEET